jgi:hypothetical protein|eukprot:SAG25_NODE_917_length_4774_cov_6.141176_6_plen_45_part_00
MHVDGMGWQHDNLCCLTCGSQLSSSDGILAFLKVFPSIKEWLDL